MRVAFVATVATVLSSPAVLRAQENEEAESAKLEATAAVATQKLAIELGAPFCDNAVLQREMKVPVWGWSKPGTVVTVEFAGQKKSAKAGKDGKWMVELDPLKASFEPAEMVIQEPGKKVVLKNILVGEVWFASGQSNMQWIASKCDVGLLQKQIDERVKAGKEKQPVIREAKINNIYAVLHPVEHATAEWSSDISNFSAIAYSFAYHVFKEVNVPIGILNCSFSQTSIQAWTPRIGFRDGKDDYTKAIYQKVLETDPNAPEHKAAWGKYYAQVETDVKEGKAISKKIPGNMEGNRDATWLFNARLNPMIPYALRGGIWNQGYANMGEGLVYYNNLHSMIRGWRLMWNRPEMPVYFNQFYCPGNGTATEPSIDGTAEMRLGTWLARDIPNTGMAIQIDIQGAIHYFNKTLSGQRLALHALKNDYGKKVVADGPMFKSYSVKGDQLIVELDNAEGGLVVAETKSNSSTNLALPKVVQEGEKQVKLFFLASEDRVWCPATVKIEGSKLIVTSPKVKAPRGISYGTGGIGFQPNIYNQAMLPLTPFIYFDNQLVTSKTWPGGILAVDGKVVNPNSVGLTYEYRKMPLLSSLFVHNAVLQADQPVVIWGSAVHDWGYEAKGKGEIRFSFAGVEKTIPVTAGMKEWSVTLPPMAASAEPKTLKVTFTIDGKIAHERVCTNVVIGDLWYVAAFSASPAKKENKKAKKELAAKASSVPVRMMTRRSKSDRRSNGPLRFTVSVSSTPENKYASLWEEASGIPALLGERIAAKTGKPVGIVFMQTAAPGKEGEDPSLKGWMTPESLALAPSLMGDYKQLASLKPGNPYYAENVQRYVDAWKKYWGEYVPALMEMKAPPDGRPWGNYPDLNGEIKTDAVQVYNTMVASFMPNTFKGVLFVASEKTMLEAKGVHYGEQLSALVNGWKTGFASPDPWFIYTVPSPALGPQVTKPQAIKGQSAAVEISDWKEDAVMKAAVDKVIGTVYP
jgi:sialate O-acetylesterase